MCSSASEINCNDPNLEVTNDDNYANELFGKSLQDSCKEWSALTSKVKEYSSAISISIEM